MEYIFETSFPVRDYEVDSQGIVNNAIYLHYFEHTRHLFCQEAGTSFREMQQKGLDPVLRKVEVEYLTPLTLGDEIVSRLKLTRQGARFVFHQEIFRLPELTPVCRGECTIVCLENKRLSRGDILAEAFANVISDE